MPIGQLGMMALSAGAGMLTGTYQDARQRKQQERLQEIQIRGNKEMLEAQRQKEMQMWQDTSYPAQMAMMKKAGLNPSLMYGQGGGGGTTVGGGGSGVSGGMAPAGGGEIQGGIGMGMAMKAQVELLQAQKENIEADTANKTADTKYTGGAKTGQTEAETEYTKGAKTTNTEKDSALKMEQAWETGLRAAMADYMQSTDEKGNNNVGIGGSMAVKEKKLSLLTQDQDIKKIGEEITLMKAKGLTEGQVYENLVKDGQLKQVEIEWNALNLEADNAGKFLTNLIKWIFKR